MKKIFCIDTNVFLYDAEALFAFDDNDIVIPLVVLEELDKKKTLNNSVGRNARQTIRYLDELRLTGNLNKGIPTERGGSIKIMSSDYNSALMPIDLDAKNIDNIIISAVQTLKTHHEKDTVRLITKDISLRVKCDMLGVPCEDYLRHKIASKSEDLYSGVVSVKATKKIIDKIYSEGVSPDVIGSPEIFPNEFVLASDNGSNSVLAKYDETTNLVRKINSPKNVWGLKARNKEQRFALDLLFDDDIKLVSLIGRAGTGKTILAVASGLCQVIEDKKFHKLVISRPIQPMGKDLGYLPGTLEEKMHPWIKPVYDNLQFLMGGQKKDDVYLRGLFERGDIEVEAITYIRGRSISNALIIIDEAQNLSVHELKTIITRVGENTKIILTGDIDQIDNTVVDAFSNGLTYAVEKFKTHKIAGHVTLTKGERSELASLATKIL